jgi:cell division protein FtsB
MKPVFFKILFGVLLGLLLVLQVRLWISADGASEMSRLRAQVALQSHENEEMALRNDRLDAEVKDLKRGFAAVEERARSELGLIAPEESFYLFGDYEPAADTTEAD